MSHFTPLARRTGPVTPKAMASAAVRIPTPFVRPIQMRFCVNRASYSTMRDSKSLQNRSTSFSRVSHAFRIGGLQYEAYDTLEKDVERFCKDFESRIVEYEALLTQNRIWIGRTKGVGILTAADAIAFGVTGPVLRASGVKWDIRKAAPYAAYDPYQFEIPVGTTGDTYDRYLVRMEEMRQSRLICLQAIENIPGGPIMAKVGKVLKPPPGEDYHTIEPPKGEIGYYVVRDGTFMPYRVHIRPPSFINLPAFDRMARGHLVADVVAIIGTIDIVLGEVDR